MATTKAPKPFKIGQKVTHEKHGTGKIVEINDLANGQWLSVEFGDRKNSNVKNVRPGTVERA